MSRFFKKAAFPALLATVVLVLAGSFSALADVGVGEIPDRPYMFTSISGDVLVDPLHFGQRTIQDIALDSLNDNYFLHYIPEYYVEPDQFPSDPNNVLYSMLKKFYVYNSEIRDYVECEMFDNIVLVPAAYVLSNDVASSPREFYFLCTTNFETYLKDGGDYLGEFYCKDVFLKLPFGPNGGQVSDPAWLW